MKARISFAVLGALALTLGAAASGAATDTMKKPDELAMQRQTISDIRNVGTAMFNWYKAERVSKRSEETHKKAEAVSELTSADLSEVPVISREELRKVLVPRYIAEIPEKDGWGHPYEFHLNTTDANAVRVMGLRSAGLDGEFASPAYEIGSFSPEDQGQDIAWIDGFFIRWPEKK